MSVTLSYLLANMVLRGLTLGSRFLLIFVLAKYLSPQELGVYGLIVATLGYGLYLFGFDFYTFTTREIAKVGREKWGGMLKSQASLSLLLYALFIPLMTLIFVFELLPWRVAPWFFVLIVLEHMTQELGRLLVAVSEQLRASLVLFLRTGVWALLVGVLMFIEPKSRSLDLVLGLWCVGALAALMLGLLTMRRMNVGGWEEKVDWGWVQRGLKIAFPLLLATLALRAIFTLDRYWFEYLNGLPLLGVYVFYVGVAGVIMSFLDAGVFSFSYPKLIKLYHENDYLAFRRQVRRLGVLTVFFVMVLSASAWLLMKPLLLFMTHPVYLENINLFGWALLSTAFYALSMVPHFGLYAQGKDRSLILGHVTGVFVFILVTWITSSHLPEIAVPLGVCFAFVWMLVWKSWFFIVLTPKEFNPFKPIAL